MKLRLDHIAGFFNRLPESIDKYKGPQSCSIIDEETGESYRFTVEVGVKTKDLKPLRTYFLTKIEKENSLN